MDICICMADSLCYSSEIVTILLIGYTPIQNKKLTIIKYFNIKKMINFKCRHFGNALVVQ